MTIDEEKAPFQTCPPLKHRGAKEEGLLFPGTHLEAFIPEAEEHTTRVPHGWQPSPSKLASVLQVEHQSSAMEKSCLMVS
jgi:hypothetical protein